MELPRQNETGPSNRTGHLDWDYDKHLFKKNQAYYRNFIHFSNHALNWNATTAFPVE